MGMVEMALAKLSDRNIVNLDEERKAAMVSNLLVVLCAIRTTAHSQQWFYILGKLRSGLWKNIGERAWKELKKITKRNRSS